jgi:TRAP-type C4-dicarboxylate transport system substrate-binding protein
LLTKALQEATAFANDITRNGDADMVKKLQENGMTLITVDKNAFKEAVKPVVEGIAKTEWDPAFYRKVQDALK